MAIELSEKQIKDGWQIVKFGEIAKNISKRVEPSETDLEVYVGLEHLDPQSLRITRRGVPADVKGQKLRVRPGQIIFGKRRAYQKKVAVADFEGICSAHAMVLEEVVGKIIPGLLPFFMQSDMFMDRAVAISEGSLSPTIKWKTLAIQEFPLPPIERQKEILEVLEKLSLIDDKLFETHTAINKLLDTFFRGYFAKQLNIQEVFCRPLQISSSVEIQSLNDLLDGKIQNGLFVQKGKTHKNQVRFLNVQDIYGFPPKGIDELSDVTCNDKELSSFKLNDGDIIFNRSSLVKDGIGWAYLCSQCTDQDVVYDCHLMRVRPNAKIMPEYLAMYAISPWARKYFFATSQTITMTTIGQGELGALPVPVPDLAIQKQIVDKYDEITTTAKVIHTKQNSLVNLKSKTISTLLSGTEVPNELQ
jgi:restriction endonuclease S subunit